MEELNILHLKDKKTNLLSGGERQRVAIARAMIKKPKLVIADEPTGNLDDRNAKLVIQAFQKIVKNGTSVIVVTHNQNLTFGKENTFVLHQGALHHVKKN